MLDLHEKILDLHEQGDDLNIAVVHLVIELADAVPADLVREVGNLAMVDRKPGKLEPSDVDTGLARAFARFNRKSEHKYWARLIWQILEIGDRDLLHHAESLMRKRIAQ